jgi:hypothetical protein
LSNVAISMKFAGMVRHYIPLLSAYAIRNGHFDRSVPVAIASCIGGLVPITTSKYQKGRAFRKNFSSRMLSGAAVKDTCQFRGDAMPEFPSENSDGQKTSK